MFINVQYKRHVVAQTRNEVTFKKNHNLNTITKTLIY